MSTINDGADSGGSPASHVVRSRTKARVSTLCELFSVMAARNDVKSNVNFILSKYPVDKRLNAATRNMRKKYP